MGRGRKGQTEQSQRKLKVLRRLTQRKGATMDYFYVPNVIKKICISQKKLLKLWNTWIHNSLPIFFYQTTTGTWRLRPETPLETEQMSNMQIKWLFIQAWRTKILHVESHILYLNHGLIFFLPLSSLELHHLLCPWLLSAKQFKTKKRMRITQQRKRTTCVTTPWPVQNKYPAVAIIDIASNWCCLGCGEWPPLIPDTASACAR